MSEVRLVVRDAERDWSGTIHASFADRAIAALSADPMTMDELEAAVARFAKPLHGRVLSNISPGLRDEPYDAGLVVIDLVARLVAFDSTYSSPGLTGYVEYHDGQSCTQSTLCYHLADDWQFLNDCDHWRGAADRRRLDRAAQPRINARAVFYGRSLLEFISRECFTTFARREEIAATVREQWIEEARTRLAKQSGVSPEHVDTSLLTEKEITPKTWPGEERYASLFYDTLSQIHAAWLLTPRDDLNGACPREVALERRGHLTWDLQDRCQQWSTMGRCAPAIAESSHAFQHGGFGTHELVKYYDLVRELLWSCWDRLNELANSSSSHQLPDALTTGDFLAVEVPRLEKVLETWFEAPDRDCYGRTPRSVINRERARIPETISGHDAVIDPDCPCCQMQADLPGPMFWHLDGCNNDDGFAFDIYHRTREEFDEDQRKSDEYLRLFNAQSAERERLGVSNSRDEKTGATWSRSFSMGDAEVPIGIRVFGLGCQLAELIVGLRDGALPDSVPPAAQQHIDQLNRDFGNLREILQDPDSSLTATLISPVMEYFVDHLDMVASDRPDVVSKCESLANDLYRLLDPAAEENFTGDDDEAEFPF